MTLESHPTCRRVDGTRLLRTHLPECTAPHCAGCRPCPERHCQVCTRAHVTVDGAGYDQTCATCLGQTRERIKALVVMSTALLGEAITRGLNSHAAHLAGPTADPEAWGHRRMSALANRIDPRWLDDQVDMHHPAWTLGTWVREARLHLEQVTHIRPTLTEARDYLDGHLTRLAHDPGFAFDELATDVRHCHDELERTLHLDDQIERSQVPCLDCGARLVLVWTDQAKSDHHACPSCRRTYDAGSFARARHDWLNSEGADRWVILADAAVATERPERTLRTWIRRERVASACDRLTHRLMVWWPDVRLAHREAVTRDSGQKVA